MANNTEITPALTADEWQPHHVSYIGSECVGTDEVAREGDGVLWFNGGEYAIDRPHAAAALCLYGQPFGFTHEDVEALRLADERIRAEWDHPNNPEPPTLRKLAAKIAALLPPNDHS